jgi:hypothetical protein
LCSTASSLKSEHLTSDDTLDGGQQTGCWALIHRNTPRRWPGDYGLTRSRGGIRVDLSSVASIVIFPDILSVGSPYLLLFRRPPRFGILPPSACSCTLSWLVSRPLPFRSSSLFSRNMFFSTVGGRRQGLKKVDSRRLLRGSCRATYLVTILVRLALFSGACNGRLG